MPPMRAVVCRDDAVALEPVAPTGLGVDEVLVELAGVGLCHTDLTALDGGVPIPRPFVPGHEGAGLVAECGPGVTGLVPGDAVVLSFDSCRACATCAAGRPAYCRDFAALNYSGSRPDGSTTLVDAGGAPVHGGWFGQSSLGTHAVASVRNAVPVPADLPLPILGPLGCGLLTGAGTVLNVLRPHDGAAVGVWGLGAVGLAAVMAAAASGATTIVGVDPNPARRELAERLGATAVFDPSADERLSSRIRRLTGGLDFAVEAVGAGAVIRQALESLASPGVCATLGLRGGRNDITISQTHLLSGRSLVGVIEGDADPHVLIPRLIEMWRAGDFPFESLVETFPLEHHAAAVEALRSGSVVKPVVLTGP